MMMIYENNNRITIIYNWYSTTLIYIGYNKRKWIIYIEIRKTIYIKIIQIMIQSISYSLDKYK